MQTKRSIFDQILALEKRLLAPKVRTSPKKLMQLLSDDFFEFGSSGQAYDKQQAIEALQQERISVKPIQLWHRTRLGEGKNNKHNQSHETPSRSRKGGLKK